MCWCQQGEVSVVSSKCLVYVFFILNIANQASLTCLANNDLTLQPTTRALRPTSQPRKSQQIAPSYLNPIICTGHSAVHCGKVGGIILVRGYHLITYSHLVAKTNLSAKAEGQLIKLWCSFSFPNKGQFTFFSLEKQQLPPVPQPVVLPHEEDVEAGEEGLLVDAEVPGHEVLSVVCGGVVHDSAVLLLVPQKVPSEGS